MLQHIREMELVYVCMYVDDGLLLLTHSYSGYASTCPNGVYDS
jgi:hypothetical protein